MRIKENILAKEITNFKTGGKIKYLIEVSTKEDLVEAIKFAKDKKTHFHLVGHGANVLVSDKPLNMVFIKLINKAVEQNKNEITAEAGLKWDKLVKLAVDKNLAGIECMSGIPGTVGAAPVQNIGAYGQELSETLDKIEAFDIKQNKFVTLGKDDCRFSYRDSLFKKEKNRYIIFSVSLKLRKSNKLDIEYKALEEKLSRKKINLKNIRSAVLAIRKEKFGSIDGIGTVGSFFKNPEVNNAKLSELLNKYPQMPYFEIGNKYKLYGGWLIEKCGWKGYKNNNVSVSDKNALVLKNNANASSQEIYELSEKIIKDVYKKFGVQLEREVNLIGF